MWFPEGLALFAYTQLHSAAHPYEIECVLKLAHFVGFEI